MKKFFTLFFAALMSVSMFARTEQQDIFSTAAEYYVVGDFNGWDVSNAIELTTTDGTNYTVQLDTLRGGFKIISARDWNHSVFGASSSSVKLSVGDTISIFLEEGDSYSNINVAGAYVNAVLSFSITNNTAQLTLVSGTAQSISYSTYYIVGDFNGWTVANAIELTTNDEVNYTVQLDTLWGGFKITTARDWYHSVYGASSSSVLLSVGDTISLFLEEGDSYSNINVAGAYVNAVLSFSITNNTSQLTFVSGTIQDNTYYIKNNWNGGEWTWQQMTLVGTTNLYEYKGVFGSSGVNINTTNSDENASWLPIDTWVLNSDFVPTSGDSLLFIYDPDESTLLVDLINHPSTPSVQYYIKNDWGGGANEWTWKLMNLTSDGSWTYTGVFGIDGVNINTTMYDGGSLWFAIEDMNLTDPTMVPQEYDTVMFVYNTANTSVTATVIGRYVQANESVAPFVGYSFVDNNINYQITSQNPYTVAITGNSISTSTDLVIPDSVMYNGVYYTVTTIWAGVFYQCTGLTAVTIPESVTTIGDEAFEGCTGLTSVTWNAINCSTNSDYYYRPFYGCTNISSFVFGNQVQKIPDYLCYELTQISSITIPNTVTYIGTSAFKGCNAFNSLIVPENVDTIGSDAFEGCNNLSLVIWNARNCVSGYWSSNSPFPSSVGTFIFGDYVQQVPSGLCRGLNQLTSIALPNTVTKIGEYAFNNCSGLISVTMEEGVQTIGDYAFQRCTNLPQIVIPNSVTKIGDDAFGRCSNLTTVTIGNHVDTIGSEAFYNCERLMSIELPTSVSYIGVSAFHGCLSMNKAIVHSTAELDPLCMILLNPQIDTIVAPASIFDIDEYYRLNFVVTKRMKYVRATTGELTEDAFAVIRRSASTLETLDMAGTTNTSLADEAFSNMYRLRTLALPSGVTEISYKAAAECVNLTQVTIPASVETIGQRAFENCRSLQAVIFSGNNLQTIGNWAFYNNHALRQITIPAGVTTVGDGAFYGCNYLEELAMPASLRNVGDNAFALCNHLTKMQVEATLPPQVAARTFFDVNRAIPVYVPDEAVNDYRTTQVWQEFFIRPISQAATGIGEVEQDGQEGTGMLPDGKFMQNGQLFIRKNGHVYDTQGRLIE